MRKKTFTDLKADLLEALQHSRGKLKLKKTIVQAKPGEDITPSPRPHVEHP